MNYYLIDQGHLKPFALFFGVAGFAVVALDRRLRSLPYAQLFLIYACIGFLGVAYLDNQEFWYYLIYSMPMFEADVRRDTYKNSYDPAVAAIKRYLQPEASLWRLPNLDSRLVGDYR